MKNYVYLLSLNVLIFITLPVISQSPLPEDSKQHYRIIAKIDTTIVSTNTLITKAEAIKSPEIKKLFKQYNVKEIHSVFRNRYVDKGKTKTNNKRFNLLGWYQIMLPEKENTSEFIHLIKKEEAIQNAYIETPVSVKPSVIPDDPNYGSQWHLNYPWNSVADIDAELAWEINKGRNDVIIAVCDGGVDYTHSDLDPGDRSRVIGGYDSADDDGDPMDDLPYDDPQSFAGHGTNVAGIIGAITDNSNGVAGVMWDCKIMPVKMVGAGGLYVKYPFGSTQWNFSTTAFPSDVADAIDYVVNNGAHVINLSYGFADMGWPINDVITKVPLLYESISNAYENNIVTVVSMGNEYEEDNPTNYPAAFYNEVIAVGNTNHLLERSQSSSTGSHINVSAPGTSIWTTERGGGTQPHSGTSMSAPVVSSIAGLIISQGKDRNFNLTNDDVRHILENTADDIDPAGFDEETGHGKVNAHNALALLDEPNNLVHGTSQGGNSQKINTIEKWSYIGGNWNLSAALYPDVDQYEITKHITFDVPFCSPPEVWIRNRECVSMNFSNPNMGYPWAEISNITTTGFDIRYAAYYVEYDIIGNYIDKWVPSSPGNTKIEYTAVGETNSAFMAGLISGSNLLCTSNETFSVQNCPDDVNISWSASPSDLFTNNNNSGATFSTAWDGTGVGNGTITATLTGNCGSVAITKDIWVGRPQFTIVGTEELYPKAIGFAALCEYGTTDPIMVGGENDPGITNVQWSYSGPLDYITGETGINYRAKYAAGLTSGQGLIYADATNACGSVENNMYYSVEGWLRLFPNPTEGTLYVEIDGTQFDKLPDNSRCTLSIFDKQMHLRKRKHFTGYSTSVDVNHLPPDVYIVRVKSGEKTTETKIMVK